jgi:hypothetical protein
MKEGHQVKLLQAESELKIKPGCTNRRKSKRARASLVGRLIKCHLASRVSQVTRVAPVKVVQDQINHQVKEPVIRQQIV